MKKILLFFITSALMLCSCSSKSKNKASEISDESVNTTEIQYYQPPVTSEREILPDGYTPPYIFYRKLYYCDYVTFSTYFPRTEEVNNSLFNGYKFLGLTTNQSLSYDIVPEIDLSTNFLPVGTPIFYNEEKSMMLVWQQYYTGKSPNLDNDQEGIVVNITIYRCKESSAN